MSVSFTEASKARQALRDSYQNLQNVADYCEKNYMEAPDKRKALECTMALVTQTLASVASQVGIAARHVSDMLEEQSQILQKEEAKVQFISLLLDIHTEKVSRRKIGSLTISKKFPHAEKILYGETNGPLTTYTRHPINLHSLDHTGHGMTDTDTQQLSKTGTMSRRISSKSMGQNHSSLGRSCRIKDPVPTPLVPEMVSCPVTPDKMSPRNPHWPSVKTDFPLTTPPEVHVERQTIAPDSPISCCMSVENIGDPFPPPPVSEDAVNDLYFPPPDDSPISCCMSAENFGDPFPPPPVSEDAVSDPYFPPPDGSTVSDPSSLMSTDALSTSECHMNRLQWLPPPVLQDSPVSCCMSGDTGYPFPPPPICEDAVNGLCFPPPDASEAFSCVSAQYMDDCLPPPPILDITD